MIRVVAVIIALVGQLAGAELIKKNVEYKDGTTVLEGYLVYDSTAKGARPGVLVTHDWMGITDRTKANADRLGELGYVAFAADVYGKGIRPQSAEEAGKLATLYKSDRKLFRQRMTAALNELKKQTQVDKARMAAIGYCFGGTGVVELARTGAPLKAVVSFHGGLDSLDPALGANIKAAILALHGADDPFVKASDLAAFEEEMRKNKVDWQLVKYGGAVHSFTDKTAGTDNSKGAAYNESADRRSWATMKQFFSERLSL